MIKVIIVDHPGGPNLFTGVLKMRGILLDRVREMKRYKRRERRPQIWETLSSFAGFEDGELPRAEQYRWPVEAKNGPEQTASEHTGPLSYKRTALNSANKMKQGNGLSTKNLQKRTEPPCHFYFSPWGPSQTSGLRKYKTESPCFKLLFVVIC